MWTAAVLTTYSVMLVLTNRMQTAVATDDILLLIGLAPEQMTLLAGDSILVSVTNRSVLPAPVLVQFDNASSYYSVWPLQVPLNGSGGGQLKVTALRITSEVLVQATNCSFFSFPSSLPVCNVSTQSSVLRLQVVHSYTLATFVIVVGWIYFVAWSISFYPQIYLNFKRRSVVGLNFDFLALNVAGFFCYSVFNVLMYWDTTVQALYQDAHPHSGNPVLLNDVVFALHALFACIVTIAQCFLFERGDQRVSWMARGLLTAFFLVGGISLVLTLFRAINWLIFVTILSYIKIVVTLCKYVPQATHNYKRKSTVGWSIGNILLDFTGGSMDILQMVLQALNNGDWSPFYGNVVKFGLGLISMAFDVLFMIQHYVLYRGAPDYDYDNFDANGASERVRPDYGSTVGGVMNPAHISTSSTSIPNEEST